jgi:WD40 repeat protein
VTAAAFAPDQTSVIVAAGTKKFVVYEAPPTSLEAYQRNAPFREFPITRGSEVRGLEVLDEGRSFAALTRDGTVEVRKYDDGAEIKSWKAHPESDARAMTASAGGGLIATVADKQVIRVWGVPSGELIAELPKLPLVIESLAFSPNGRLLAAGEASRGSRPNAVHLFDLSTKQLVKTYVGHKGPISALQFLPDGELLMSASRDMSVRYWKLPTE